MLRSGVLVVSIDLFSAAVCLGGEPVPDIFLRGGNNEPNVILRLLGDWTNSLSNISGPTLFGKVKKNVKINAV